MSTHNMFHRKIRKKNYSQTCPYTPPVFSNHLPLKTTVSDPIKGKEIKKSTCIKQAPVLNNQFLAFP